MIRRTARCFADGEIRPAAAALDAEEAFPAALYRRMAEVGLFGATLPEADGGTGADARSYAITMEEVARGYAGLADELGNVEMIGTLLARAGTARQKQKYLSALLAGEAVSAFAITEAEAGSDVSGIRTTAERHSTGWRLNGEKTYISNGILSDLVVVAARTDPESRHGLGLFVVERGMEGFERGRKLDKMGMQAQDTAELFFNDVKVPKANVLGDPSQGFRYLARFLAQERLVAAIGFLATAHTAFDITLDYVKERRAFGKPIGAFQNTRFKMATMRAELDMAQTYVDQCVLLLNAGELAAEDASAAKLLTSELEARVMDECVQLHGGAGYMSEYRISRMYRDARISRIFAGTSEIMREIIGRSLGLDERKLV